MEQLTLLCATQFRASSPARKMPADMPPDNEQLEVRSRWDFLPGMALSSLELAPGLNSHCLILVGALQPIVDGALDIYFSFHLKKSGQVGATIISFS